MSEIFTKISIFFLKICIFGPKNLKNKLQKTKYCIIITISEASEASRGAIFSILLEKTNENMEKIEKIFLNFRLID